MPSSSFGYPFWDDGDDGYIDGDDDGDDGYIDDGGGGGGDDENYRGHNMVWCWLHKRWP